jgi:hypothetical protein
MPSSTPGPTDSLGVIEGLRRHISEKNCIEVTEVHTQFKGGRTAQNVDFPSPEVSLELAGLLLVELSGMLFNPQRAWQLLLVQTAVVVRLQIISANLLERARTSMSRTDTPKRQRLKPSTNVTLENRVLTINRRQPPPVRVQPPCIIGRKKQPVI